MGGTFHQDQAAFEIHGLACGEKAHKAQANGTDPDQELEQDEMAEQNSCLAFDQVTTSPGVHLELTLDEGTGVNFCHDNQD